MKPDVDLSHLEPEKKSGPTDVTPTRPMRALSRSTYSPTEDLTKYDAPPPKSAWARLVDFLKRLVRRRHDT
jgi:hypothetical protein